MNYAWISWRDKDYTDMYAIREDGLIESVARTVFSKHSNGKLYPREVSYKVLFDPETDDQNKGIQLWFNNTVVGVRPRLLIEKYKSVFENRISDMIFTKEKEKNSKNENSEEEIWKDIILPQVDLTGYYKISNYGAVYSVKRNTLLNPIRKQTYNGKKARLEYNLYKDGARYTAQAHYLVASAFIPNPDKIKKPYVNILDGDIENLRVSNLKWISKQDRIDVLTKSPKPGNKKIYSRLYNGNKLINSVLFRSISATCKFFGIHPYTLQKCINKNQYLTLQFEEKEKSDAE